MARYERKHRVWDDARNEWVDVWVPITAQEIKEWYESDADAVEYTTLEDFTEDQIRWGNLLLIE